MTERWGLWGGLAAFVVLLAVPAPADMPLAAWRTTALVVLMAVWWMTQALPLTATALLPFLLFPLFGVMNASETAAAYYSPILFLVLGGAIIALAIGTPGLAGLAVAVAAVTAGLPRAGSLAELRAPLFEEKVVDHVLGQVKLVEEPVSKETLFADEEADDAGDGKVDAKSADSTSAEAAPAESKAD